MRRGNDWRSFLAGCLLVLLVGCAAGAGQPGNGSGCPDSAQTPEPAAQLAACRQMAQRILDETRLHVADDDFLNMGTTASSTISIGTDSVNSLRRKTVMTAASKSGFTAPHRTAV